MSSKEEAFRKAAEYEAGSQDYDRLSTAALEEWIKEYIDRHQETWTVIWKAARKVERAKWEEAGNAAQVTVKETLERLDNTRANLDGVLATAQHRLNKIRELELRVSRLETERNAANSAREAAVRALRASTAKNSELRAELDQLKQDWVNAGARFTMKALDEAVAENVELKRKVRSLEGLLLESKADRKTLDAENERLDLLVDSLQAANKDYLRRRDELITELAEEKAKPKAPKRPEGNGWILGWTKLTTSPSRVQRDVVPCGQVWIAEGYEHKCTEPKGHVSFLETGHRCHCRSTR